MAVKNHDRTLPYGQWQIVDVQMAPTAKTDTTIPHTLSPSNPEGIDYQVIRKGQPVDIYHDTTGTRKPWGQGYIVLRANVASAFVSLLLTVPHDARPISLTKPVVAIP